MHCKINILGSFGVQNQSRSGNIIGAWIDDRSADHRTMDMSSTNEQGSSKKQRRSKSWKYDVHIYRSVWFLCTEKISLLTRLSELFQDCPAVSCRSSWPVPPYPLELVVETAVVAATKWQTFVMRISIVERRWLKWCEQIMMSKFSDGLVNKSHRFKTLTKCLLTFW